MKNLIASALVILAFALLSLPVNASAWPKGGKKGGATCNCGKAPKEPKAPREHKARGHKASADGDAQPIG